MTIFFFFKQKTAYEMRISDWSSDVCSSDLFGGGAISVKAALFDMADYSGQIVTNLFEEDGYFADSDAFWAAQQTEIEKRKAAYLEDGWIAVAIVPTHSHFSTSSAARRVGKECVSTCRSWLSPYH